MVEVDAAVKTQFAEQGTKDQLLATLRSVREQAERIRGEHIALAVDLAAPETRFPDRRQVNELVMKFMWEQNDRDPLGRVAEDQVSRWPEDISLPRGPEVGDFLRALAA